MTDKILRSLILKVLYENRRFGMMPVCSELLSIDIDDDEVWRIFEQLKEQGLVEGHVIKYSSGLDEPIIAAKGRISAAGVDTVEGEPFTELKTEIMQTTNINITGSTNVAVGNNNTQHTIIASFDEILSVIERSSATNEQKTEVKAQLKTFLGNASVAAILGGAASAIIGKLLL